MRNKDENKEAAVRDAALKMIVEQGFKGLSMQKLAKEANVSPATIYIYYKDRGDLLNKLYLEVLGRTNKAALQGFSAGMTFAAGLKLLWLNRFRYYTKHPGDFYFIMQFINSPLIAGLDEGEDAYGKLMQAFYKTAVKNKEVAKLPLEVYWTMAYAPLYQLIRFHLQKSKHPSPNINITEIKLLAALQLVLKALQP
jgi:AcrR family transcriptional regulator